MVFTEVDDLSQSALWGAVRAAPLRRHPFALRTGSLDLCGLTLQTGRSTPLAVIGALPRGTACVLLPLDGRETLRLCGGSAEWRGVAAFGAGAAYEMANRQDASWGLLTLPAEWGRSSRRRAGWRSIAPAPRPGCAPTPARGFGLPRSCATSPRSRRRTRGVPGRGSAPRASCHGARCLL
ncbi:MAG TPA: hypothetical protein VE684_18555 [Crenalkalicoccus sp.]|nr:hypothetical protein [Crenalkalicoccus sp.]